MFQKRICLPIFIVLLAVIGCGLFDGQKGSRSTRLEVSGFPLPTGETAVPLAWVSATHLPAENAPDVKAETAGTASDQFPAGFPCAAVPEDMPDSLRFPCALRGVYHRTRELSPCEARDLQTIFTAIVRDYNPGRSRAAVWPAFLAAEKVYRAHAAQALGEPLTGTLAGSRYEWQYAQAWAFPEIMECFITERDPETLDNFVSAFSIAMGDWSQDHNEVQLLDGRVFRMRYNYKYVFKYNYRDGVPTTLRDETAYTPGEPRPEVVIDVLNTSDADLERLSGWDFRINPITNQPFQEQSR